VKCIDMLEIQIDNALRYVASVPGSDGTIDEDSYPVRRGTAMKLDDFTALVWVHGATTSIHPTLKYFQGKRRIPAPLALRRHAGWTDLQPIVEEILGLSKMNWNTADLYTKLPATLHSSNEIARIGSLLQRFGASSYDAGSLSGKTWFREHANLILQVYGIADIHRVKTEGKTGVILGWQNAVGFDDHLPFIEVAYELGLRIVQMTYNTATSVGSGCYESNDGGLTDFGRDVVDEFNRLGILVDLSHVGSKTRGGRHCLFEEAGRLYALPSSGAQMEAIEYVGLGGAPYRCNRPSLCRSIRARPRQRLGYRG
jgi:hypothetical protein